MLLGEIIARLEDEGVADAALASLDDLKLAASITDCAAAEGVTPGAYAASAVALFAETASDEDWVSLMGALGHSADPGTTFLKIALSRGSLRSGGE